MRIEYIGKHNGVYYQILKSQHDRYFIEKSGLLLDRDYLNYVDALVALLDLLEDEK